LDSEDFTSDAYIASLYQSIVTKKSAGMTFTQFANWCAGSSARPDLHISEEEVKGGNDAVPGGSKLAIWLSRMSEKDWQVVVPLRVKSGTPYLFDALGVDRVVQLMERILESADGEVVPFGVESRKFHLVGTSNGGTSVAAVAARIPHLVASLTLVTGEVPDSLVDFRPLRTIPAIRLYVGDKDEMGHYQALQDMYEEINKVGGTAQLHVLEGARHGNIGHYIDMASFWDGLHAARWMTILR